MANMLLDLLEKGESLDVTGVDGLAGQVKAFSTVVGGLEAYTIEELSEEVGQAVEAITVLFKALEIAHDPDTWEEGLLDDINAALPGAMSAKCIQLAREACGKKANE